MAIISKENKELYDLGDNDNLIEFDLVNPTPSDVYYDLFNTTTLTLVPTAPTSVQLPPSYVSYVTPSTVNTSKGIAYNPVSNLIYVIRGVSNVLVLNTTLTTFIVNIPIVGSNLLNITYNSLNNTMYVSDALGNNVYVIDCNTNTIISTIPVGTYPSSIAYNPLSNRMYVCNETSNDVSVINCNTNTVIATIPVGTLPLSLAYNSSNNTMYVNNSTSNNISIINCNTNTVTSTIAVSANSDAIAYNSTSNTMYLSINAPNSVLILDCATNTFIGSPISIASSGRKILYLSSFNLMYVTTTPSGMYVIDCSTNTIINNIAIGTVPVGITYNTLNNSIYVTRDGVTNISLISPLSSPPNAYIGGSFDYNAFIQDVINNPVCVERVVIVSQNTRDFNQVINVIYKDANGIESQNPFIPSLSVGTSQFQSGIGKVDFLDRCLVLGVNQYFSNFLVAANSIVKVLLIYKQLEKSKLLSDKKGMCGRLEFKTNPLQTYKPTKDAPAFDYFQKVNLKPKVSIRPFSIKDIFKT